jgi:hypothetical protein
LAATALAICDGDDEAMGHHARRIALELSRTIPFDDNDYADVAIEHISTAIYKRVMIGSSDRLCPILWPHVRKCEKAIALHWHGMHGHVAEPKFKAA